MSESAAVTTSAPADTAGKHAHAVGRLRRSSLAQLLLLLVQTGLGMGVSLYVTLPAADQGKGVMASFGDAVAKGPASVAVHAIFGMLVFVNACVLLVFSLTVRSAVAKVGSVIGLLCIAGAAMSGASFVNANQDAANGASLTMALLTLVAVSCYAINLFVLRDE